jgi:hypothetical protein
MAVPASILSVIAQAQAGELGKIEQIKIGDVLVDVLTNVTGSDVMRITRKPVEAGFNVTDAAILEPVERTFDIILTNPEYSATAAITAAISGTLESFNQTYVDKRDTIYGYFNNRETITISTHEEVLESMMIQSITPRYDTEENLDAWVATIHFQEYQEVGDTAVPADDATSRFIASKQNIGVM